MSEPTRTRTLSPWAVIGAVILLLTCPQGARAADVYVNQITPISDIMADSLEQVGHDVTIGVFDADESIEDFPVVIMSVLPLYDGAAREALLDYVEAGGGLIITEPALWQAVQVPGSLDTIDAVIPVTWLGSVGGDETTYAKDVDDPVIHRGIPGSFEFSVDSSLPEVEAQFSAKDGATVFFRNGVDWPAVVGWSYGAGRVVSISTWPSAENLFDGNYQQLLANLIEWAGGKLEGRDGSQYGRAIENVGDLDGDDVDDIVVSAPFDDENGNKAGKIYVISGATCETLYIKRGGQAGDRFGWALAKAGDIDDDGYKDFLVSAPWSDQLGDKSGSVKLLSGRDGSLIFKWLGEQPSERLGYALGSVDVDNDGKREALLGAPFNDEKDDNAGKVYVYSGDDFELLGSILGKSQGDRFGSSVAGVGKMNAGARKDFVVGAPFADTTEGNKTGKVYAISGKDFETLYIKRGRAAGDRFGSSVDGVGTVDGDGLNDFVVGSPFHDFDADNPKSGLVEVFSGKTGARIFEYTEAAATARIGWSVAGVGDVNDDGLGDIIVGAPWTDSPTQNNLGTFLVLWALDGDTVQGYALTGTEPGALFGYAVASTPFGTVIGAPKSDAFEKNGGRVAIGAELAATEASASGVIRARDDRSISVTPVDSRGDLDGDGRIDTADLLALLERWGDDDGAADLDGDGLVGTSDLLELLGLMSAQERG